MVLGVVKRYNKNEITWHHLFSLLMLSVTFFSGKNGYMLLDMAFWGEINNPLINLAEVMEYHGVKDKFVIPLKLVFMVTFIGVRCSVGTFHVFEIQMSEASFLFKICPTFVVYQSYEWTFMMLNKVGKLVNDVSFSGSIFTSRCSRATNGLRGITISSNF